MAVRNQTGRRGSVFRLRLPAPSYSSVFGLRQHSRDRGVIGVELVDQLRAAEYACDERAKLGRTLVGSQRRHHFIAHRLHRSAVHQGEQCAGDQQPEDSIDDARKVESHKNPDPHSRQGSEMAGYTTSGRERPVGLRKVAGRLSTPCHLTWARPGPPLRSTGERSRTHTNLSGRSPLLLLLYAQGAPNSRPVASTKWTMPPRMASTPGCW